LGGNVNLYVSFHGGKPSSGEINNVYSYPLSGGGSGTPVLGSGGSLRELRCLALRSDGSLLVNNAYKDDSRVVGYSTCTGGGTRSFVSTVVSNEPGLSHPYGITVASNGDIYVSNQDSNSVTRYDAYGNPLPLPPALANGDYNPGTFAQYDPSSNGIRGLTFDAKGNLWVASEDTNQVTAYNPSGYSVVNISVSGPVGVFFESATNKLYIGSKSSNTVKVWNLSTNNWSSLEFSDPNLSHPAGIAVDTPSSNLYVALKKLECSKQALTLEYSCME